MSHGSSGGVRALQTRMALVQRRPEWPALPPAWGARWADAGSRVFVLRRHSRSIFPKCKVRASSWRGPRQPNDPQNFPGGERDITNTCWSGGPEAEPGGSGSPLSQSCRCWSNAGHNGPNPVSRHGGLRSLSVSPDALVNSGALGTSRCWLVEVGQGTHLGLRRSPKRLRTVLHLL